MRLFSCSLFYFFLFFHDCKLRAGPVQSFTDTSLAVCSSQHMHKGILSRHSHTMIGEPVKSVVQDRAGAIYCRLLPQNHGTESATHSPFFHHSDGGDLLTLKKVDFSHPRCVSLFHVFILFFPRLCVGNCTRQRSCPPTLLRLTMRTWTRMRSVMAIVLTNAFRMNALHSG